MSELRPVFVMLLVVANVASAVFCLLGASSWSDVGFASGMVVAFTPIKGVTYRRLGGVRPFLSALVATFTWQVVGLPIDLDTFWLIIAASFVASFLVDTVALLAMATLAAPLRSVLLALYGASMVHLLIAGFVLFYRSAALGLPMLFLGSGLFLLPAFFSDRFLPDAP